MKILTTYPIPESKRWQEVTVFIDRNSKKFKFLRSIFYKIGINDWWSPFKLLLLRNKFDVLFTGTEREDIIFALFQLILPGRKIPHVMTCCLWKREENAFIKIFKKFLLKLIAKSVALFVVWSQEEIENYHKEFGIPKDKLKFIPHHSTLKGYNFKIYDGNYIFAGGNSSRDYITLIKAVQNLSIKTIIALTDYSLIKGINIPNNVKVVSLSREEFRQYMAGSKMVVVPLKKNLLQSAGQQTYLNAMSLRKPVIVSKVPGVEDYISNYETGIIVEPENSQALRKAISFILNGNDEVKQMIDKAYMVATRNYTLDKFVERNLYLINKYAVANSNID